MAIRFFTISFLILALLLISVSVACARDLPDWLAEVRPGYSFYSNDGNGLHGMVLATGGGYRLFDNLFFKLDFEYASFGENEMDELQLLSPSIGAAYDLDILPVIVGGSFLAGPQFKKATDVDWQTEAFWHFAVYTLYMFKNGLGVGAEFSYNGQFDSFSDSLYLTAAVKLQYRL